MILTNDVQVQHFLQTAVGATPGTINGILVPKGSDFDLPYDQKLLPNTQVQADGIKRPSGRGNKTAEGGGGKVLSHLNYIQYMTKGWCGSLVTTGTGPYTSIARVTRTTIYRLYELGLIPLNLFYLFYDQVTSELHLNMQTEGIFEATQKLVGSGKVPDPSSTSLDTTPTELVAPTLDMTGLTILENAVDAGDTISLSIDCVTQIVQKRPTGAGAIAKQLRQGGKDVSGKVKFFFELDDRASRVRAGTLTTLKGTMVDIDGNTFEAYMPEVELEPVGPKFNTADGVTQEFTFNSIRKTNMTDSPIRFTHVNTTAVTD